MCSPPPPQQQLTHWLRLPGRVAREIHCISKVAARRSAKHDALLRVQVEGGAQLRQRRRRRHKYHSREAEEARAAAVVEAVLVAQVTARSPRAGRRDATDCAHLTSLALPCCFYLVARVKVRIVRRRAMARSFLTVWEQLARRVLIKKIHLYI